jgi:hypothetical protein
MAKRKGGLISNSFKIGLGAAFGFALVNILFIFVGSIFFIPGLLMLKKEKKKPMGERDMNKMIIAYILMGLGSILGFGLGASVLIKSILSDFE